ncbi:YehR family lipoprotein [Klebsiella electrica]|uniref:YehR family lipoprotein n=1 Tax=Klebsiella electrica TaxID=1259973 RepID=A0AAJ5UGF0_9ENTR|nr:YehR family lipoprotein [Klebsiella electrica]WBW62840.1 YehR family lipoprotein [Klebsiella electrica]
MKLYRKLAAAVAVCLLVVGLSGCDNPKEESKTFTRTANGVELSFTYHYTGDKVLRQDANNTIPYQSIGAASKEQAQALIEQMSNVYHHVKGVEQRIDYQDSYALEHLSVDFTQVQISELCKLPGSMFTNCALKEVSMAESEKLLKEQGFQEVK